jgi:hypothetical protein
VLATDIPSELELQLREFIKQFGWSRHVVEIRPAHPGQMTQMRQWCRENIGRQLDHEFKESNLPIEEAFWLSAVAEGTVSPVFYAFRLDRDAVHFKLRWYGI